MAVSSFTAKDGAGADVTVYQTNDPAEGADLEALGTKLDALQAELEKKADLSETQPVSAASLPLPAGAATAAKQDTQTTHLAAIEAAVETPLSRTADAVSAALATDVIMAGTAALTPQFAFANLTSGTTDGALVAAVASKKIRVLALVLMAGADATTVTFNSKGSGAGTPISMGFAAAANGGASLGFCPVGWFETASGEALTVTTGGGSAGVQVVYAEV